MLLAKTPLNPWEIIAEPLVAIGFGGARCQLIAELCDNSEEQCRT